MSPFHFGPGVAAAAEAVAALAVAIRGDDGWLLSYQISVLKVATASEAAVRILLLMISRLVSAVFFYQGTDEETAGAAVTVKGTVLSLKVGYCEIQHSAR